MRIIDELEFFYNFIEAKENREKSFRIEGVPITFIIGRNDGTTFCVSAHYDEILLPYAPEHGQKSTFMEVIETDRGDYVCDYLERVNNVIRRAMQLAEVRERGISFQVQREGKPFFWTLLKDNLFEYVGWITGLDDIYMAA